MNSPRDSPIFHVNYQNESDYSYLSSKHISLDLLIKGYETELDTSYESITFRLFF